MWTSDRRRFLQSLGVGAVVGVAGTRISAYAYNASTAGANSAVVPGLVHWRSDFAAACLAAQSSGRPVMLLHMLGRLDQQFC